MAFASLTHNRLTTFARLPDHSNTLLRVLLLESSSFTRVTPRTQLRLDCAVFNTPTRHATSVGASNRAGPIKTSRSGKPKVQFGPVLSDLKLFRNYSESTAQGAGWIALSRPPQCVPCARLQISRKPTRAGTVPSGLLPNLSLSPRLLPVPAVSRQRRHKREIRAQNPRRNVLKAVVARPNVNLEAVRRPPSPELNFFCRHARVPHGRRPA